MIYGTVSGRQALVTIPVGGSDAATRPIEFIVDTGFVAFLALPRTTIASLGLPFDHHGVVHLADGSHLVVQAYLATIAWDGEELIVEVLALDGAPLLGTALLDGHALAIEFVDNGSVTIEPL